MTSLTSSVRPIAAASKNTVASWMEWSERIEIEVDWFRYVMTF